MERKSYGPKEICEIAGISGRQLGYWKLIGIIRPRQELHGTKVFYRYTDKDLELLKAVKKLTEEGYRVSRAADKIKAALARNVELTPNDLLSLAGLRSALSNESPGGPIDHLDIFKRRLNEELVRSRRFGYPLSCLAIRFEINPKHEDAVDSVARYIEETLNSHKRAFDMVVRVDPQEFLWLLCQSTSEGAQNLAARIGEWLNQQPAVVGERRYNIRIKTSASTLGPSLQSEDELMEQARAGLLSLK